MHSSAKSTPLLCVPTSTACAVQQVLSVPERDMFPVVCPAVPVSEEGSLRCCLGWKRARGSDRPVSPAIVRGGCAPHASPRAAAGLCTSSGVSACAAESLIQQQIPRVVSKASWSNHLQASHLGGSSRCRKSLLAHAVFTWHGDRACPRASPRGSQASHFLRV